MVKRNALGIGTPKKLNVEAVVEIKKLLGSGLTQEKIAGMYGVTQTAISAIKTGKAWKHVK